MFYKKIATFLCPYPEHSSVYILSNEAWPRELGSILAKTPLLEKPITYIGTSGLRNLEFLSVILMAQLAQRLSRFSLPKETLGEIQRLEWDTPDELVKTAEKLSHLLSDITGSDTLKEQLEKLEKMELDLGLSPPHALDCTVVDWNPNVQFFWELIKERLFSQFTEENSLGGDFTSRFKEAFSDFFKETAPLYLGNPKEPNKTKQYPAYIDERLTRHIQEQLSSKEIFLIVHSPLLLFLALQLAPQIQAVSADMCKYSPQNTEKCTLKISYVSNIHNHLQDQQVTELIIRLADEVQPDILIASRRINTNSNSSKKENHPSRVFTEAAVWSYRQFISSEWFLWEFNV